MAAPYFADSFFWIALANPADAWNVRVSRWRITHPNDLLVTTEEVLSEVLTWFAGSGPAGRAHAAATARDILNDPVVQVLPQTTAGFHAALALYESRPDKGYSLTDCRSMNALRDHGITDVLTNDHHFTQEGFTIVFPGP
jgi:predicted nucleic acid-binding protein